MEFHEMLQRDLVKKEKIISKMKEELVVLRGPVSFLVCYVIQPLELMVLLQKTNGNVPDKQW